MNAENYGLNTKSLQDKLYNFNKQKIKSCFTVTFYYGKQNQEVITRGGTKEVKQIDILLKNDKPDKIKLEFFKGDLPKGIVSFYVLNDVDTTQHKDNISQFHGFGELEIQNLVDQRLREVKQIEEFNKLKSDVIELTAELNDQIELVEQLEEENEKLKADLETKKQLRYYAGMLGNILEGIGISKEKIRNPIASLMGISDEENAIQKEDNTDASGIVDESNTGTESESKRLEIINVISEFLKSRDNETLTNIFNIFSEIETDQNVAIEILSYLASKKVL